MPSTGFQRTLSHLATTPNGSAAEVLIEGIQGPSPQVRNGSLAALARRSDEHSQQRLLDIFSELSSAEIQALENAPRNLRKTLRKVLADHESDSAEAACHFILACRAFDEFPALVAAATDPEHPGGDAMACTAQKLAQTLHDEILAYRRAPSGRDPSFARRWATTALTRAVERFDDHRRIELLDAFLLITTPGNHALTQLLTDETHPAHESLKAMLRTSTSMGAVQVLAGVYDDPTAPLPLLEVAADRTDAQFRNLFLQSLDYPASPRILENVGRLRRLPLLEKPSVDWFTLGSESQCLAVQLVAASKFSRRTKLAILNKILDEGAPTARIAACESLVAIELPEVVQRLESLLEDSDPKLVVAAATALRRKGYTGAIETLAGLLQHRDADVRTAAKTGLRDFTFLRYVGEFDRMNDALKSKLGQIVRDTDATATQQLERELKAASLHRKLRGMQMAASMQMADQVLDTLVGHTTHPDAAIRAEAIATLSTTGDPTARRAIAQTLHDANALVRNRAAQALSQWGTGTQQQRVQQTGTAQ